MVGVRAKVLGQMGWTTSPYLRASALSCPSLVVYRAGVLQGGLRPLPCSAAALYAGPSYVKHDHKRTRCVHKKRNTLRNITTSPAFLVRLDQGYAAIPN